MQALEVSDVFRQDASMPVMTNLVSAKLIPSILWIRFCLNFLALGNLVDGLTGNSREMRAVGDVCMSGSQGKRLEGLFFFSRFIFCLHCIEVDRFADRVDNFVWKLAAQQQQP